MSVSLPRLLAETFGLVRLRISPAPAPAGRVVVSTAVAATVEHLECRTLLAGTGIAAAYFARSNLTAVKFSRTDSVIDFAWAGGTPAASLGTDGFSTRWVGRVNPKFSGTYTFITRTSGGVRLWVNGQLVIDAWNAHSLREDHGNIALTANTRVDIRMDYWSDGNSPAVRLDWQSSRLAREVVPTNRLYAAALDRIAPTTPPRFRSSGATSTSVQLTWDRSSDPSGVVTYDVYMGSTKLGSTSPGATSYTRTNLSPHTGYTFSVQAIDAAGNVSSMANTAATTSSASNNTPPSAPANLRVSGVDASAISLAWSASRDSDGKVVSYRIYRNGVKLGSSPTGTSFTDTGLSTGVKYSYTVRAVDNGGAFSGFSNTATALTAPSSSNTAPSVPSGLHVTNIGATSISLAWSASSDHDGSVTGYRVYRNGVKLDVNIAGTTFTDSGLAPQTSYTYTVRAIDNAGASSGFSNSVSATTIVPTTRNAFSPIVASNHDDASGVSSSGSDLDSLDDGDFVRYISVDFGNGAKSVKFNLSQPASNRGGWIELHLDSVNGQELGRLNIQPTGSGSDFATQQVNINNVSGVHDLYLVFRGRSDMATLRSIQFSTQHLVTVMPLGDSITQQDAFAPSYRYYLWHKLMDAGLTNVDFVGGQTQAWTSAGGLADPPNFDFDQNHEGHAGWRADEIASAVAGWASVNTPDIVMLMAGTNDFVEGQDVASTLQDIGHIIDNLRAVNPNVKVLVAQLIPDFQSSSANNAINQFNAQLPAFIQGKSTAQSQLITVNQNTGVTSGDTQEGLHTNSSGDQKLAQKWFDALAPLI
jgi:chitodextrinase